MLESDLDFVAGVKYCASNVFFSDDLYGLPESERRGIFQKVRNEQTPTGLIQIEGRRVKWDIVHFDQLLRPFDPETRPELSVRGRRLFIEAVI